VRVRAYEDHRREGVATRRILRSCPTGRDQQPAFDNFYHTNRVLGLVMEHYNDVARTLMDHPECYSPLFAVDTRNGDILWELWIEGFEQAVKLQPAAWRS
jgi:uncharacterized protein